MATNILDVWKKGIINGKLTHKRVSSYAYRYLKDVTSKVSLSMPTDQSEHVFHDIPPVFQSSLPEGELRKAIVQHLESSLGRNVGDMDILAAVGSNGIGSINFTAEGSQITYDADSFNESFINDSHDEQIAFNDVMHQFFLSGVAGVQPKFLARSMATTDLVVKSYNPHQQPALTVVEHVCMEMARLIGLDVANTSLSKQGHVLFVERFDRDSMGHSDMEELCSIMGFGTTKKYTGSYEGMARTIGMVDPSSLKPFFKQMVFHNIIRNGDAHLKNFAILNGRMSPMYDAVCTAVYNDNNLALYMGGTKRWATDRMLVAFGSGYCGLNAAYAISIIDQMKHDILMRIDAIDGYAEKYQGLRHINPVLENMKEHIFCGCGQKTMKDTSLTSIKKLLDRDRFNQTFADSYQMDGR